jgi:NDP-sugar pyrophosphorylase family protein
LLTSAFCLFLCTIPVVLPALVLTAGLGTRLDPLTRLVAKAAVPLGGSTLIERVLDWLGREGVRDIVLNLHHLPHTITRIVGDGAYLGMRVRYSWEQPVLGSAGGPRRALPLLESDTFFIVNGDTLCDFSLTSMLEAHRKQAADVTLAVVPNPDPNHYNGLVLDADDRVTGWLPKGRAAGTWHFIGVQVARAEVFAGLPDGVPAESMSGVYQDLLKRPGRLCGFRPATPFLDVGTPRDYLHAALSLEDGRPRAHRPTGRAHSQSVVWDEAIVDEQARLHECIVAGRVSVPAGFEARESVIVPAAIVRTGDTAEIRGEVAVFPFAAPAR